MTAFHPLSSIIADLARRQPQAPAFLAPGRAPLSYKTLNDHMRGTARQLARLGFVPGDTLAVVLPNGPESAVAFLSISALCTCAPLNPAYNRDDFKFSLQDLHVRALITSFDGSHSAREAASELSLPVIELHPDADLAGLFTLTSSLPETAPTAEPPDPGPDAPALVLHTSGTTSRPKIVLLTQGNLFYSAQNISQTYMLTPDDRCLNMMPLFHVHGLIGAVAASLAAGGSVICAPGFDAAHVLDWLEKLQPDWTTAVPTILQALYEQASHHPEGLQKTKLRFIRSCSSALAPELARNLETLFRAPVLEAYGMTEATHQIASNPLPPRLHKFGSVGIATGTTRASILDSGGQSLPPNTPGEICIRGENVITQYFKNPAANASGFTDGWLRTGDRGIMDEEGYIFIQGRLKELINRGGEKIAPREIDETLQQHPAVRQAVAFAVPHPTLGEDIAAAVVLKPNQFIHAQELRAFAADRLVDFKVPRQFVFVKEIPKGPTGKVQRIGLAEKLKAELHESAARHTSDLSPAETPLEARLVAIWQQVMDEPTIGIHEDFFSLGGDSLMAARILMEVQKEFGVTLTLKEIFSASTVVQMADLIQQRSSK